MHCQIAALVSSLSLLVAFSSADFCASGSFEIDGNWYCSPVKGIRYTNVGISGAYKEVIEMSSDGDCKSTDRQFGGPLAPLNEEISMHFRGPLELKQFAVYYPSHSSKAKRKPIAPNTRRSTHVHSHQKAKNHRHEREIISATIDGQVVSWENNYFGPSAVADPVDATKPDMVIATIDGQVVSWVNNWFGSAPSTAPSPAAALQQDMVTATIDGQVVSWVNNWHGPSAAPVPTANIGNTEGVPAVQIVSTNANDAVPVTGGLGSYERVGYYHADSQELDNLVFLGNHGGQGSGVFDYNFGASLSYVNSDGTGGSSSPQILANKVLGSGHEYTIMLAQECNGDCGYVRPGSVAYHGFDGADKVFLFEFSMPMDGDAGFEGDMPAIWALNANIPRTLQYGKADCSCWTSGCGEFDIVEALHIGSRLLKSTLHATERGGDSDYIERPVDATAKMAVVFSAISSSVHIQILPDDTEFATTITTDEIDRLCSADKEHLSLFTIVP